MTIDFPLIIDILGTFSFAAAGAFAAMEKKLDPFGVFIIAFVTAIGGGTIRDLLIGATPVAWLTNMTSFWVILTGALVALFFASFLRKLDALLLVFDALGLGLFTIVGVQKGLLQGLHPGVCVALGTITGCFGGVLRDVLLNKVPLIFHKEIYASASILGGIAYILLASHKEINEFASIICIILICVIRLLAVRFNWSLPLFYDKNSKPGTS